QQVHTCTKSTCLHYNKHGKLVCKRCTPWELSDTECIDKKGNWKPKQTHPYVNNYCPVISVALCCNNDIKLLTNGADTKHVSWYSTDYQTKKQNKNNNLSAPMAKSLLRSPCCAHFFSSFSLDTHCTHMLPLFHLI
ncbi:hypothetical protein DFH29DRAFT_813628, partial [Suillus ampliporus]